VSHEESVLAHQVLTDCKAEAAAAVPADAARLATMEIVEDPVILVTRPVQFLSRGGGEE
jgi:hypothetical protein